MNYCLKQGLLAILFASVASAVTLFPSDPVFVLGPQGRPIPNAVMTFQDSSTGLPAVVYTDSTGTVNFGPELPSTGLVQFWAQVGRYFVTVSGAGYTRTFYVVVVPAAAGGDLIWIDRSAEDISIATVFPPTLVNKFASLPTLQTFENNSFRLDFIAPSFKVAPITLLVSWSCPDGSTGSINWQLSACAYHQNDIECTVAPIASESTNIPGATLRQDTIFSFASIPFTWNPKDHVIFEITRTPTSPPIDTQMEVYSLDLEVQRR